MSLSFSRMLQRIQKYGLGFYSQDWNVAELSFVLCLISTELISSAIALLFALPIGLAVALVTSEDFCLPGCDHPSLPSRAIVNSSVIIGLWGILC